MFTHKRSTQIFNIPYHVITLLAIPTTVAALATTFNPESAVFENQTCQHNKCIKFNLERINNSWEFLAREVTPSCCSFTPTNVTIKTQVSISDSHYKMAEADPTTTNTNYEDYDGPPVIDDARVSVSNYPKFEVPGFPKLDVSQTTSTDTNTDIDTTTTVPTAQPIPKPAAQKADIAKKISQSLARFIKTTVCKGDSAAECLAKQSINLIKHQANARQSTTTAAPTSPPPLVISPCKIKPDEPGCYAWADLTNNIIAPVLNRLEKFKPGYLDKYPSDKNSRWSKVGQNLFLQSISQPPANQELSVPAMASMILKQSSSTQAETRMARIEATQRGWEQQNLSILLFIPSILMFLFYTALNISKFVKFLKKTKTERQEKKDQKEFSRSQRLKALLEPPPINPRIRTQNTIEMQELV